MKKSLTFSVSSAVGGVQGCSGNVYKFEVLLTSLRTTIQSREFPLVCFFRFTFVKKRENAFTKKVFTFSLLKIQHCSSYSCCTELASGDCQGKNYNPVCWLMFLTED